MVSKRIAGAVLAAGMIVSLNAQADNLKEFRVCKPYRIQTETLRVQIENFDVEVLQPLERELAVRSDRVRHRASDESKLERVVRDIQNTISTQEGRLRSNPGAIEANKRRQAQARQDIAQLEREIVKLQKDLEDAGFIKRPIIKKKIKNRKKDIKKEEQRIVNLEDDNRRMAQEIQTLPGTIASNRTRLVTAEGNLAAMRNRVPTLASLRNAEAEIRRQLDSQEDIEAELRRDLVTADREFVLCRRIADDARSYRALRKMVKLLKGNDCDLEATRRMLPYNTTPVERQALQDAFDMVCAVPGPVVE